MASNKIDFGPHGGGVQSFKSTETLKEYVKGEISKWIFSISESPLSNDGNFQNEILRSWRDIITPFESIEKRTITEEDVTYIENIGKGNPAISIDSYIGNALKIVLNTIGADGCHGALLIWSKRARFDTLHDPKGRAGASLFLALTLVDPTGLVQRLRKETDLALNEYSNSARAFTEQLSEEREINQRMFHEKTEIYQDVITKSQRMFDDKSTDLSNKLAAAEAEIERLTATFKEKIRLEAPSSYWTEKSKDHNFLHVMIAFGTILFGFVFGWTVWHSGDAVAAHANSITRLIVGDLNLLTGSLEGQKFVATLRLGSVIVTAVLISTLAIWTLRYLVRMMISENHLKADAQTRSVLISTYIALRAEDGITEQEDRKIILNSIFTLPSDGLLKDDGLPNWLQSAFNSNR